jgi:glycosyltransferase involved in cell wall biosynthesis
MPGEPVRFSVVLPCYNEAENIPLLLERYARVWPDEPMELILVDNGSTDHTARVMEEELARPCHSFARRVTVPVNQGYGHGIMQGLKEARGEIVGFSHADMQCSPEDVFSAYRLLKSRPGPEKAMVKGKRQNREPGPAVVTLVMSVLSSLVLGKLLTDINAQPKVFHRSHLSRLQNPPPGFELDLYVMYKARQAGLEVLTVPVVFGRRIHGQSKWAFSLISRYRTILGTIRYIFHLGFGGGR